MSTDNNGVSYKTLNDLPIMEETNDNTYALVADGDSMKRVPGSMLGGGGIKTAIIKNNCYDVVLNGETPNLDDSTLSCLNLSFEEAYATVKSGNPLGVILMYAFGENDTKYGARCEAATVLIIDTDFPGQLLLASNNVNILWGEQGFEWL